jgi:hypothetical protein
MTCHGVEPGRACPLTGLPVHDGGVCDRCMNGRPPARVSAIRFSDDGFERRVETPPCRFRGAVIETKSRRCCGGRTRIDELYECRHPENGFGNAWVVMCLSCRLREAERPVDKRGEKPCSES